MSSIRNLQIWAPAANSTIPFRQVVTGFETVFEDEIIQRINRERVITALADPRHGEAPPLLNDVRAAVETIDWSGGANTNRAATRKLRLPARSRCLSS